MNLKIDKEDELRPYNAGLILVARELRKDATLQENRLWYDFLRKYKPRFTRQRIFGNYILDFYCAKTKLAIELDGPYHYEPSIMEYDMERTEYLNSFGITVLRFPNTDVDDNFNKVCESIRFAVTNIIP